MQMESKSYEAITFGKHVRITLQKSRYLRQEVTLDLRQETT